MYELLVPLTQVDAATKAAHVAAITQQYGSNERVDVNVELASSGERSPQTEDVACDASPVDATVADLESPEPDDLTDADNQNTLSCLIDYLTSSVVASWKKLLRLAQLTRLTRLLRQE